jgi:hypothetical protein
MLIYFLKGKISVVEDTKPRRLEAKFATCIVFKKCKCYENLQRGFRKRWVLITDSNFHSVNDNKI